MKYLRVCFSVPVWHQRWKSRKELLPGQIVFIKEDKELAQLRGMTEAVGLANACYAVRYVLEANAFSGQKTSKRASLDWFSSMHSSLTPQGGLKGCICTAEQVCQEVHPAMLAFRRAPWPGLPLAHPALSCWQETQVHGERRRPGVFQYRPKHPAFT